MDHKSFLLELVKLVNDSKSIPSSVYDVDESLYKIKRCSHYTQIMNNLYAFEKKYALILETIPKEYIEGIDRLEQKEKEIVEMVKKYNNDNDKEFFHRGTLIEVYEPLVKQIHQVCYKAVCKHVLLKMSCKN